MSLSSINNYGINSSSNATSSTSGNGALTMDDFFKLLVAQLSNQDMYNTMDDSQFMAQMAQFSMVQALADLSQASATSYGVSLIGKEVTLARVKSDGTLETHQGIVETVTLYNGSAQIVVDDVEYPLSSVMEVKEPNIIIPNGNNVDSSSSGSNNNDGATDGIGDSTDNSEPTDETEGGGDGE